ncbi:hypothetical protein TMO_a0242 (plasmid) [Tistrella mobilis KA081020-065]|uniref:Uncharacterized protein n=1 Tax=Tistrella mobilis (strain KA081020-065) TaxID=1110502 RepID=I3TSA7_TISMK|nr:hypothetical protein TMO_a0242 [Tistrella mobilis KA081020-065]
MPRRPLRRTRLVVERETVIPSTIRAVVRLSSRPAGTLAANR